MTAKNTAKASTPKAAKGNKAKATAKPERKERGLSESRVKILKALKATPNGLTRSELSDKTGIAKGWAKLLGAATKGKPAAGTMEGDGLVKSATEEGERGLVYTITPAGKAALDAAK